MMIWMLQDVSDDLETWIGKRFCVVSRSVAKAVASWLATGQQNAVTRASASICTHAYSFLRHSVFARSNTRYR